MSIIPPNIAIVILAAGASKRMGTPKQLLKWGNDTLLGHAIHTALQSKFSSVFVVLGANYDVVKPSIDHCYPIIILRNSNWKLGLGSSIACAAKYLIESKSKADGMLITLADQPLIDSDYINTLINNFQTNKNAIVATSYSDNNQGVPVLFDRVYFEALSKLQDDTGAKHLLKKHQSYVKALIPPVKNVDLDSQQDYELLHKANFNN